MTKNNLIRMANDKFSLRSTDRLEYFSDAVIAIAATLLAVELPLPRAETLQGMTLLEAMGREWPSYAAFAASFLFIGIAWVNHHEMFLRIQRTNHILLMLSLLFLMGIVLFPFGTELFVQHLGHPKERTAAMIYYGIMTATALFYNVLWWYAVSGRRLVARDEDPALLRALSIEYALAPILHAAAFVVAMWSVRLSLIPLVILYIFFALPRVSARMAKKRDHIKQQPPDR